MITNTQRYDFLMTKVDQYKEEKKNRKIKRSNWENWKKTQEIIYDKYEISNAKWDFFYDEESDEEFEKREKDNQVLPTNDPNFKAMEKDMEERSKRIAKRRDAAEKLKKVGNDLMKKQKYQEAAEKYTEAIGHIKDSKV